MAQSIRQLERDIEESRARLDSTLDRIQERLSLSGIADDALGNLRRSRYATTMDQALAAIRDNPVPVLLIVAGLGWLIYRVNQETRVRLAGAYDHRDGREPAADPTYDVTAVATTEPVWVGEPAARPTSNAHAPGTVGART